jgi:hypothetical protein
VVYLECLEGQRGKGGCTYLMRCGVSWAQLCVAILKHGGSNLLYIATS